MGGVQGNNRDSAVICLKEQGRAGRAGLEDKGGEPGKTSQVEVFLSGPAEGLSKTLSAPRLPMLAWNMGQGRGLGENLLGHPPVSVAVYQDLQNREAGLHHQI